MTTAPLSTAAHKRERPRVVSELLHRPTACVAIVFLVVVLAACVFAPLVAPYGPAAEDLEHVYGLPTAAHLLGTDNLGRDLLSRLLFGGRVTLLLSAEAVATFIIIGTPIGLIAGYAGGRVDRAIMWISDLALSLPGLIILLVVAAVFSGHLPLMISLGVMSSPGLIRVTRAATLSVRNRLYVRAAEVVGLSKAQVIRRHVLPAVLAPVLVQVTVFIAAAVVIEAALGYLDLDVNPPAPSWGSMIADAATVINQSAWQIIPSGVTIVLTCVALGVVGDAIREISTTRSDVDASDEPAPASVATTGARVDGDGRAAIDDAGVLPPPADDVLLSVRDVAVTLSAQGRDLTVVDRASFDLRPGECLGIVGESGCGKTMMSLAILGLLPPGGRVSGGSITFDGVDLRAASRQQRQRLRGREIAFISQEPMLALDPGVTVGSQLREIVRRNQHVGRKAARREALHLLEQARLPNAEQVARRYPHELSGGMAQRACIALALAGRPKLLIADEPTTALDVTVQAEIIDLLKSLQRSTGMAIMLVSHDWGVIADACDHAAVMYAGQVVELAAVSDIFTHPFHPYSSGLLAANPHRVASGPLPAIPGTVPNPAQWPVSCRFAARCSYADDQCLAGPVPPRAMGPNRITRCVHPERVGGDESPAGERIDA